MWRGAFAMLAYAIKESSQELLLCLWRLFEKNIEEENQRSSKAALHLLSPHSRVLRSVTTPR